MVSKQVAHAGPQSAELHPARTCELAASLRSRGLSWRPRPGPSRAHRADSDGATVRLAAQHVAAALFAGPALGALGSLRCLAGRAGSIAGSRARPSSRARMSPFASVRTPERLHPRAGSETRASGSAASVRWQRCARTVRRSGCALAGATRDATLGRWPRATHRADVGRVRSLGERAGPGRSRGTGFGSCRRPSPGDVSDPALRPAGSD